METDEDEGDDCCDERACDHCCEDSCEGDKFQADVLGWQIVHQQADADAADEEEEDDCHLLEEEEEEDEDEDGQKVSLDFLLYHWIFVEDFEGLHGGKKWDWLYKSGGGKISVSLFLVR